MKDWRRFWLSRAFGFRCLLFAVPVLSILLFHPSLRDSPLHTVWAAKLILSAALLFALPGVIVRKRLRIALGEWPEEIISMLVIGASQFYLICILCLVLSAPMEAALVVHFAVSMLLLALEFRSCKAPSGGPRHSSTFRSFRGGRGRLLVGSLLLFATVAVVGIAGGFFSLIGPSMSGDTLYHLSVISKHVYSSALSAGCPYYADVPNSDFYSYNSFHLAMAGICKVGSLTPNQCWVGLSRVVFACMALALAGFFVRVFDCCSELAAIGVLSAVFLYLNEFHFFLLYPYPNQFYYFVLFPCLLGAMARYMQQKSSWPVLFSCALLLSTTHLQGALLIVLLLPGTMLLQLLADGGRLRFRRVFLSCACLCIGVLPYLVAFYVQHDPQPDSVLAERATALSVDFVNLGSGRHILKSSYFFSPSFVTTVFACSFCLFLLRRFSGLVPLVCLFLQISLLLFVPIFTDWFISHADPKLLMRLANGGYGLFLFRGFLWIAAPLIFLLVLGRIDLLVSRRLHSASRHRTIRNAIAGAAFGIFVLIQWKYGKPIRVAFGELVSTGLPAFATGVALLFFSVFFAGLKGRRANCRRGLRRGRWTTLLLVPCFIAANAAAMKNAIASAQSDVAASLGIMRGQGSLGQPWRVKTRWYPPLDQATGGPSSFVWIAEHFEPWRHVIALADTEMLALAPIYARQYTAYEALVSNFNVPNRDRRKNNLASIMDPKVSPSATAQMIDQEHVDLVVPRIREDKFAIRPDVFERVYEDDTYRVYQVLRSKLALLSFRRSAIEPCPPARQVAEPAVELADGTRLGKVSMKLEAGVLEAQVDVFAIGAGEGGHAYLRFASSEQGVLGTIEMQDAIGATRTEGPVVLSLTTVLPKTTCGEIVSVTAFASQSGAFALETPVAAPDVLPSLGRTCLGAVVIQGDDATCSLSGSAFVENCILAGLSSQSSIKAAEAALLLDSAEDGFRARLGDVPFSRNVQRAEIPESLSRNSASFLNGALILLLPSEPQEFGGAGRKYLVIPMYWQRNATVTVPHATVVRLRNRTDGKEFARRTLRLLRGCGEDFMGSPSAAWMRDTIVIPLDEDLPADGCSIAVELAPIAGKSVMAR